MPAFARSSLLAACLFAASTEALAQSVYMPVPPSGPGGEDVIETASGTRCRQSMNSNGAYLDVGITGRSSTGRDRNTSLFPSPQAGEEAVGYARVTMPLGRKPDRLDCTRLYELEIARMKREIELLKLAAE